MEYMQFTAVVLMTLLTLKLLLLPGKVSANPVATESRWMMAAGTMALVLQFLLQLILGLRAMGVTQAAMLNLSLFIPCSWMFSLAVIYLQRRGNVTWWDKFLGGVVWVVVIALLLGAAAIDDQPLLSDTRELRIAEMISSVIYILTQAYYTNRHILRMRAIQQAMENYFDSEMVNVMRWMQLGVIIPPVMATMVPLLIFCPYQSVLAISGIVFFAAIFFLIDSFCNYVMSSAPRKVLEAESNEQPDVNENVALSTEAYQRVDRAVEAWLEKGGHLKCGLNMPTAAETIGVPRYLLASWLHLRNLKYSEWMTDLRIEEAKRAIINHPDWNNETIALHCGFNDRSYFQKKFKEKTGLSPADYQTIDEV